ncbi:MAG: UspA domain-containing protein [Elusimicrobia bacterium]|nr:MAG: UspA domain-containing protein [Elusimicrobiota bacterium]
MQLRPKAILVAVDVSDPAMNAIEAAQSLAKVLGGELHLVCVVSPRSPAFYGGEGLVSLREDWKEFKAWSRRRLAKLAAGIRDVPVSMKVVEGTPEAALAKLASSDRCGLAVLGTHGYTGVKRVVFGSVAESVVRHASVPVLTMPPGSRLEKPRRILVPYNMAHYAARSLRVAAALAEDFDGGVSAMFVAEDAEDAVKARKLNHSLKRAGGRWSERVRGVVRFGDAVRSIVDEAESGRHDLLILAAHRKSFWKDMLLGTTAERVLRHCPIPVLAVPSGPR